MSLKNPVTPSGIDAVTVRLVAQRLNSCVTPGPTYAGHNAVKIEVKLNLQQDTKAQRGSRGRPIDLLFL
jgi:hypothetical protein